MTTSVGCESEILLLREYAEKPTGMNKYNILRAGKAALIAFQNFIHHAVECLARVDGRKPRNPKTVVVAFPERSELRGHGV